MKKENILIIGSGGREHAIGFSLSSPKRQLFFAPGNVGTKLLGKNIPLKETQIKELAVWAKEHKISLTIVGPEVPLALGIAEAFAEKNLAIFAPSREAALLESSKANAAVFMKRHNIPHPTSVEFDSAEKAIRFIAHHKRKVVIKASGLASGKGVVLPATKKEAVAAVKDMMEKKIFGDAGEQIVIQERIFGPEVSILALSDGKTIVPLLPAQDHKRIFDGDKGPNTGGMGAYAPVPLVSKRLLKQIQRDILQPTIDGMWQEGRSFIGVLFAGLMLTKKGPMVLEYNVRFGDPETQAILPLLQSDLYSLLCACLSGTLRKEDVIFAKGASVAVVLAASGYPNSPKYNAEILGTKKAAKKGVQLFFAGAKKEKGKLLVSGGRVLAVAAHGSTLPQAIRKVYRAIGPQGIHFEGMQYRKDIGAQAETKK